MSTFLDMNSAIAFAHIKKLFFCHFIKILNNTRTDVGDQLVCLPEACCTISFHVLSVSQSMLYPWIILLIYQEYKISKFKTTWKCSWTYIECLIKVQMDSVFFIPLSSYLKCDIVKKTNQDLNFFGFIYFSRDEQLFFQVRPSLLPLHGSEKWGGVFHLAAKIQCPTPRGRRVVWKLFSLA